MFSATLERRRRIRRFAALVAATLLASGLALIAVWALRAVDMLGKAEADRAPVGVAVLIALAVLLGLCLFAYGAIRAYGRFTTR